MPPLITDFDKNVLEAVIANPGQKARVIAHSLGVDKSRVNAALRGPLRGKVRQDSAYCWYPQAEEHRRAASTQQRTATNTPLAQLSRYYLDCLSHDDLGGVSEFASSNFGDLSYVELKESPSSETIDPFESLAARNLLTKARNDRNRKVFYLGYPTRLKFLQGRNGWEGYKIEPILLFPFQEQISRFETPKLSDDLPQFNFAAIRSINNTNAAGLMEEAIQLADELGFGNNPSDRPDLDELLERLREIRTEWDWQEEIDPHSLSVGIPISDINKQGIFNRCVLVSAERSPYTKGLETELGSLQTIEEENYSRSAIGLWLESGSIESPPAIQQPLIEVLPLNSEQRQAVQQSLSNPLTVVTGPPGTGKSQVVASILMNAAYQGKTVLFASKNNKAVDVVETRVNSLGPRPVLLRLGINKYQEALAQYLVTLLGITATDEDTRDFEEAKALHAEAEASSQSLDGDFKALIDLRNQVDRMEREAEELRKQMGHEAFSNLRELDYKVLEQTAHSLQSAIRASDKNNQSLLIRLIWPFVSDGRLARLDKQAEIFEKHARNLALPMPHEPVSSSNIDAWIEYNSNLTTRLAQINKSRHYLQILEELNNATPIEELTRRRGEIVQDFSEYSERLWHAWLRLQPTRMTPPQRRLIGDYTALLQMIAGANAAGNQLGGGVFRRFYELFPKITSILPCWAITALAARGKLPFESGFFDLLVIDEASQCDIASALPLLYRAKRAVIIGDSMQLPHISALSKQQDQQILEKHDLIQTRPGWSYSTKSLFDLAASLCRPEDVVMIRDHFRSHSDIIRYSNETFYDGRLRPATAYEKLQIPYPDMPAVRWIDVQGNVVKPSNGGAVNESEAQAVVAELEKLIKAGYRGSIGVVSPFRAQANRIRDIVSQRQWMAMALTNADFLVDVVHSFQGDERDVILFSPVVSRNTPRGALWFIDSNEHKEKLFNVSVTRARAALIVVGDKSAISGCASEHLRKFVAYTEKLKKEREPEASEHSMDYGESYPSVSNPDQVSHWERYFYAPLYERLKKHGIWPMPQYSVDKYHLDFALVSGKRRLNIEIDGERYHRNWDGELCRRDQIRNLRLMELGWDVMRFWVYQIRDDLDRCLDRVEEWCDIR
jgi:very-short-patch-repair endonuclease